MAPGRKRGANRAKNTAELSLGDLVLAKVKGFPPWPAKVSRPEDWDRTPDPKKYFVQFFGTLEIAFVAPADIQQFTSESKNKLMNRCKGKTVKFFAQAVKEISEAFDESERNKSVDDGSALERCTNVQESTDGSEMEIDEGGEHKSKVTEDTYSHLMTESRGNKGKEASLCNERIHSARVATSGTLSGGTSKLAGPSKNVAKNSQKDLGATAKDFTEAEHQKKSVHPGSERHDVSNIVRSGQLKRPRHVDSVNNVAKSSSDRNGKTDASSLSSPDGKLEKNLASMKDENRLGSKIQKVVPPSSGILHHETAPPLAKRQRGISDTVSDDRRGSFASAQKTEVARKRRAIRLCDDDEDEMPKTPVHGSSFAVKKDASSSVQDSKKATGRAQLSVAAGAKSSGKRESVSLKEGVPSVKSKDDPSLSTVQQVVEKSIKGHDSQTFVQQVVDKSNKGHDLQTSVLSDLKKDLTMEINEECSSPKISAQVCVAANRDSEEQNGSRNPIRESGSVGQIKAQNLIAKVSNVLPNTSNYSQSQVTVKKVKQVSAGERPKVNTKILREVDPAFNSRFANSQNEKNISSSDSKAMDAASSMKSLIAAAQARRKQAQMASSSQGNIITGITTSDSIQRMDSSPLFAGQQLLSGSRNSMPIDALGISSQISAVSPSGYAHDSEEHEDRKPGSAHQTGASSSLSGGTDAAVARDAFEGMIETLSRTKESIGRATRLAVDCAKYGIANEVVDLLIRKLESEASSHRKVDLFFLVDSITQCSHNQKGIAGASYIPAIQAALPRLLGAAAAPGASGRENRRQCLKVLRLWLERRILPEAILRQFMDEIGSSNDEVSSGLSFRRPSRAERAVDDPIRDMEGMLVDEYGSNATFQLPGFFPARAFDDEEEDEEGGPSTFGQLAEASPTEPTHTAREPEAGIVTPSDRPPHILEDVDGELEMEDVSGHQKGEMDLSTSCSSEIYEHEHGLEREKSQVTYEEDEALTPEGSPPLPLDPPPALPPLPSSPPPPPLPSCPPPLPPPPPPLHMSSVLSSGPHVHPPPLPPQHSFPSQVLLQPSASHSPSPQLAYQTPVAHDFGSAANGNQIVQMAGNGQQQSTCFVPAGVSGPRNSSGYNPSRPLEYGNHDMFINSQTTQPSQQLQATHTPYSQGIFHQPPPLPAQTISSQFSFSRPPVQQHLQPPYPSSYQSPSFPDKRTRFAADDQPRSSGDYRSDNQHGTWMNTGRAPTCSATHFVADGYYPPPERPPANNMRFQHSTLNSVSTGHANGQMLPSRSDVSTLNSWRPA